MISILVCCLFAPPIQVSDPFVIITSAETPLESISRAELRRLYLKRTDRVGGVALIPLQFRNESGLQKNFVTWLFGTRFDFENHWIEERLRGGAKPPIAVLDTAHMLVYIERNPGFIGFLPADRVGSLEGLEIRVLSLR